MTSTHPLDTLEDADPEEFAETAALGLIPPVLGDAKIVAIASQRLLGPRQVHAIPVRDERVEMLKRRMAGLRRQRKEKAGV